jgi:hypothetical protein
MGFRVESLGIADSGRGSETFRTGEHSLSRENILH